jgi:hypothetical protein
MVRSVSSYRVLVLTALIALSAGLGQAAYLQSDYEELREPQPRWEPRLIIPRPPPPRPPVPDWGLRRFVRSLTVGAPVQYGYLTVFPLYHPDGDRNRRYMDMDEALRRGDLEIRERGGGVVSEVIVTNHSGSFVFLLAGEILVGGKQNRILRRDVLIAPYSEEVIIPAYCVERGRWTPSPGRGFRGSGFMSGEALRRSALESGSQEEVWDEVTELSRRHSYASPTEDLGALYEKDRVKEWVGRYRRGLGSILRDDPVGVVVCRQGRIISADFFVDSHLFRAVWPGIVSSHVVELEDPICRRCPHWPIPSRGEVERFLRRVEGAALSREWGAGAGTTVRISGFGIGGTSLIHRDEPVHTTLFPQGYWMPERREP